MIKLLTIIAGLLAISTIWARYKGPQSLFFTVKPLTTLTMIGIALWGMLDSGTLTIAPWLIVAGLVFCLVGDIFIMLGEKTFIYGLVGFALAHVLFILALVIITELRFTWWLFLIFAVIGFAVAAFLLPYTGKLKIPVSVYMVLIVLMIWLSFQRFYVGFDFASAFMALGTILFGVSDTTLAINKFKGKFKSAELIILGTYYPAIWCIAYSLYWASI